jgi:hypothetical protein
LLVVVVIALIWLRYSLEPNFFQDFPAIVVKWDVTDELGAIPNLEAH